MDNILGQSAFWTVNKTLAKHLGLEEALFVSDLISKDNYFKKQNRDEGDGYFFNTISNIQEDTGLTYRKQKRVINNLIEAGIISTKLIGMPTKLYFRVNYGNIKKLLGLNSNNEKDIVIIKESKEKVSSVKNEEVDKVYSAYPSKCIIRNATTGKSKSSKLKIEKLLKEYTSKELIDKIDWYVSECNKSSTYMKNFNTFLNNLPEIDEGEKVEDKVNKKEIIKLVKWLSSNYIMREPDELSDRAARNLEKLGYNNKDFLKQFMI